MPDRAALLDTSCSVGFQCWATMHVFLPSGSSCSSVIRGLDSVFRNKRRFGGWIQGMDFQNV